MALAVVTLLALGGCGPETPEKFLKEGFIQFQQQNYDGAIQNYEKAIALGAKSSNAYNMLGMAYRFKYQQTKDPKLETSEILFFQKAVEIDPGCWMAMVNLGTTYYYRGDKAKAAVWFKKALAVNPQHPEKAQIEKMIAEGTQAPPGSKKGPPRRH